MDTLFHNDAWEDYLYWQKQDSKTLNKINNLIKDIKKNGYNSIGKPEQLSGDLKNYWSVRIDQKNRIVFKIEDNIVKIIQCGSHYRDK